MLDLRRLRLLRELHERGTIAAVADALQFTPSAVSQQLAMLEREAGVPLLERAGRGVRLTDAGARARRARRRAARARRARRGRPRRGGRRRVAGRARIAGFQSVALRLAHPGDGARSRATRRGCAASSSRPSPSRRCPRSRSATSTSCSATSGSTSRAGSRPALERHDLLERPGARRLPGAPPGCAPAPRRRAARRARRRAPGRPATPAMGWDEMTPAHLPRARRLRARRPPPHQRRDDQPRARRARAGGRDAARARRCPAPPRRRRACGRSPRARSAARSSPSPAPPTPPGPRRRRCWPRSATPYGSCEVANTVISRWSARVAPG